MLLLDAGRLPRSAAQGRRGGENDRICHHRRALQLKRDVFAFVVNARGCKVLIRPYLIMRNLSNRSKSKEFSKSNSMPLQIDRTIFFEFLVKSA